MPHRGVRSRLSQTDTWLLELFLSLYTLLWGVNFVNPLTEVFANSPRTYLLISAFPGGEQAFGLFGCLCGALLLFAVLRGSRETRSFVAGIVGVVWLIYSIAIGVPTGGAAGFLSLLVALALWFCWSRLRYRGPT